MQTYRNQISFFRDEAEKGTINVRYCRSNDMIADMLTKGLHAELFIELREMAGLTEYDPK